MRTQPRPTPPTSGSEVSQDQEQDQDPGPTTMTSSSPPCLPGAAICDVYHSTSVGHSHYRIGQQIEATTDRYSYEGLVCL